MKITRSGLRMILESVNARNPSIEIMLDNEKELDYVLAAARGLPVRIEMHDDAAVSAIYHPKVGT